MNGVPTHCQSVPNVKKDSEHYFVIQVFVSWKHFKQDCLASTKGNHQFQCLEMLLKNV